MKRAGVEMGEAGEGGGSRDAAVGWGVGGTVVD